MSEEKLLDFLYSAPGNDTAWGDFLRHTSQLIHSDTAELALFDSGNSNFILKHSIGVPSEAVKAYNTRFGQMDEWYIRARGRVTTGYVGPGETLCSRGELVKTEFYNEFLRKFDWIHSGAAVVEHTDSAMAVATFVRGPRLGPFEDSELEVVRALLPHIRRALMLHRRIVEVNTSSQLAQWGLDQVPFGVILLASDGKLICTNRIANELCATGVFSLARGAVHLRNTCQDRRLQLLIRTSRSPRLGESAGGVFKVHHENLPPLIVSVAPIRHLAISEQSAVVIFLTAPDHRLASPTQFLVAAYGLTPAEIRLAELMADGRSATQAAEQLQLSRDTVKSQLSSIFRKTGVGRQAELTKLLSTLPPMFRMDR